MLWQLKGLGVLNQNVLERVDWFTNPKGTDDYSLIERQDVAREAWRMFTEQPILGHGLASTKDWSYAVSSHNQYLNLMVDHGILGAFILPVLVLANTTFAPVFCGTSIPPAPARIVTFPFNV